MDKKAGKNRLKTLYLLDKTYKIWKMSLSVIEMLYIDKS
jgi:hypothetical protein